MTISNRCLEIAVVLAMIFVPSLASSQTCQVSDTTVTNCSPSGQDCGEPTESNTVGNTGAWPQGTTVTVNINTTGLDPTNQANIVAAITQAFNNWNGVGGVTFNVSTSTSNASGTNVYNVHYGADPDNQGANAFSTPSTAADGTHVDGNDTILYSNNLTTCTDCFTKVMAHEIGHTFGLNDNSITNSAMQDMCSQGATFPDNCMALGPTQADMSASDCEASYTENDCNDTDHSTAAACQCGAGTSGDCNGGLVCQGDGTCGCSDPCDDPYCAGWTQECGTCRDDGDCAGGTVCQSGQCGCSDACDDASCPGYTYCGCNDDVVTCDCPSNSCASESCPGYDDCTCNPSDCEPTCNPDGDECDPNSCSYNEPYCDFECECDGLCGDLVKSPVQLLSPDGNTSAPQAKPAVVVHPMCKNNEPSLPFKAPSDGSIVASLGTKTSIREGVVQC